MSREQAAAASGAPLVDTPVDLIGSIKPMRVHVADHPLITHKLTVLRDEKTPSPTFRALAEELMTLLAYEANRNVRTKCNSTRGADAGV